jgi:hypothetical protein
MKVLVGMTSRACVLGNVNEKQNSVFAFYVGYLSMPLVCRRARLINVEQSVE